MRDLQGKTVVVTGASSGIGAAVAAAFGAAGSRVGVQYRSGREDAERLVTDVRAAGGEATAFHADLATTPGVTAFAAEVLATFDRVDVVVNCVGGFVRRTPFAEADDEIVDAVFDLNVRSTLTLNRLMIASFRATGRGNVINLTSQAARSGGTGGAGIYAASKAYLSTYTRSLAKELAAEGIRVNAIAPGVIDTPFHDGQTAPDVLAQLTATIPMGRLGTAEECAGTALYLASDELSGYVTGQIIEVNGGQLMP